MIKAVIFDYGGVIKHGFPLSVEVAEIYRISDEEVGKLWKETVPLYRLLNCGRIDEGNFWQKISLVIKKPVPENCINLSHKIYEESFVLRREMMDFAKKLKDEGFKTAVLSNIAEFQAEIIRKKGGYNGFDVVVLSYEAKIDKPDPEIYYSVIKRLSLEAGECIFIDDKEKNLFPAKNMGMKTVLAQNSIQIIKDVNYIIDSQQ